MSDLTRRLSDLAERINAEIQSSLFHAKNVGELLLQAKEQCPHGQWLPWLKANVHLSERTAQAYMQVAKRWPELEGKPAGSADSTLEGALAYLADLHEADRLATIKKAGIPEEYHEEALEHMEQAEPREATMWWYKKSGQRARDQERAKKEAAMRRFQQRIRDGELKDFLLAIGDSAVKLASDFEIALDGHPVRFYENAEHCERLSAKLETLETLSASVREDLAEVIRKARAPKVIPPGEIPLLPGPE
jgi:hypothetical protein